MHKKKSPALRFIALFVIAWSVLGNSVAHSSSRMERRLGLAIGLMMTHTSGGYDGTVSYNAIDPLRLSVRYGSSITDDINNFSSDVKFFPFDWNFSPFLVGGYISSTGTEGVSFNGSGFAFLSTKRSYSRSGVYTGLGVDWQSENGFNLGLNYKMMYLSPDQDAVDLYVGWFF